MAAASKHLRIMVHILKTWFEYPEFPRRGGNAQ
jgi:hypothetical protein